MVKDLRQAVHLSNKSTASKKTREMTAASEFETPAKKKSAPNLVTPYRYQTITMENLGYSGANVDVRPYGISKYHFVAEFDNELGLDEGDMVYLVKYVDNEWLEAELDANRR